MTNDAKLPGEILTVVFRDDGPMVCAGDCPSYRSVRITLTDEQRQQLARRFTYSTGGSKFYEDISRCFIEPANPQPERGEM